jgi:hypothetical protein
LLAATAAFGPITGAGVAAQTTASRPQPGFNLFTVQQDIDIGRQSALEAERQLKLLPSPSTNTYLNRIITRLAASAPGAKYPYNIKAVNAPEINAFALPGGPMYVNRGLIEAARTEAELAGVLAHEMSHVAMRHGTHQASKAYLSQAGLGILGGLLGRSSGTARVLNAIGGVGLNTLFLKFSRDDEYEADQVGAEIMSRAGYDPNAMANFFELLRAEQGRNPSKVEQFFSDHPSTSDRETRIRQLAKSLGTGRTQVIGGFDNVRASLRGQSTGQQQVVQYNTQTTPLDTTYYGTVKVQVPAPSSRMVRFNQPNGFFSIDYPDNWQAYPSGYAVSMAPEGGVHTTADGRQVMLYGVIINHYTPFRNQTYRDPNVRSYVPFEDRTRGTLESATDDLVRTLTESNSYLVAQGTAREVMFGGARGYNLTLAGRSPVTGEEERVIVYTRGLADGHVMYALSVVPGRDYGVLEGTFNRMLQTLSVDDNAYHRSSTTSGR